MMCFLACFGSSKNKRGPKSTSVSSSSALPPKVESFYKPVQQNLAPKQAALDQSIIVVSQSAKQEGELSAEIPKKVTFVSDVRVHNPRSDAVEKATDISTGTKPAGDEKITDNRNSIAEKNVLTPASESGGSNLSISGSYPPNHRYHNCRESDNEDELECEVELDLYDYDEEDSPNASQERAPVSFSSMESRTKRNLDGMIDDHDAETKTPDINSSQLTAVKTRAEQPLTQKENSGSVLNLDEREQAIDASLSSWLVSSQNTPSNKANTCMLSIPSETTQISASSHGSNSVRSFSDRPILGALTIEELRQISVSESPRKSPSQSKADRPIIGSVGSHWSEETPSVQSGPASSFKGIPNTTSKYREDKRVKWHSTPFETRLEQALQKGASGVPF